MKQIPINLAVEDVLSEVVLRKILKQSQKKFFIGKSYSRGGFGYLKKTAHGFNNAAKGTPFLLLTDLDEAECPPVLVKEWLPVQKHHNFLFRVAVKEVEAWLLAHQEAMAKFLGISRDLIPRDVERIDNPKKTLVGLAAKSKYREIREALVPKDGSTAKVGRDYNGRLSFFVEKYWDAKTAMRRSQSLQRTITVINKFKPIWQKS